MSTPTLHPGSLSLADEAAQLRRDVVEALYATGGGHYGGSMSVLDLLLTLYRRVLRVAPDAPNHPDRDRLILSKGHAAIALYAVLRRLGYSSAPLDTYGDAGSPLEGHPDMHTHRGVDFSTGSLGQGLSVGLGMALSVRERGARVWVVLGDGECQEGQVWEAAMLAARLGIDNLVAVVDANGSQEIGWTLSPGVEADPVPDQAAKWRAFGWRVVQVDGHDHGALEDAFASALQADGRPVVVIAHTTKGRGYALLEADPVRFHCATLSPAEHQQLHAAWAAPAAGGGDGREKERGPSGHDDHELKRRP